jgi:hypothetical protein
LSGLDEAFDWDDMLELKLRLATRDAMDERGTVGLTV